MKRSSYELLFSLASSDQLCKIAGLLFSLNREKIMIFANRQLDLSSPRVMGVLNITPDSFSDGGELMDGSTVSIDKALNRAAAMLQAGASIIDVGGESTRPGAETVSAQEEMDRLLPVIEAITKEMDIIISVDTSNPGIIRQAGDYGVGLINDVRALTGEGALAAAVEARLPVCLMHMQGHPENMQDAPEYLNIMEQIKAYLQKRIDACTQAGISPGQILIDPGFGFGKTLQHNIALLGRLEDLQELKSPVLVGLSRKAMIGSITGKSAKNRLAGSVAAAVIAVMKGAKIVRTHDVEETVDAIKVCSELLGG